MARVRVTLCAALALACAECSAPPAHRSKTALRDPLVGVWDLTLTMTEPKPGVAMPPARERRIALALVRSASDAVAPGYLGLYDGDLTWLAIHPFIIGDPARATGRVAARSVRVVLNDTVDFGRVVLDGRADAQGRISGSWEVTDIRRGARGRFSMQPRWPRAEPAEEDALTGIWQLTLRVELPGAAGTALAGTGLRGVVVLLATGAAAKLQRELLHFEHATHGGLHSVDLEPIGVRRVRGLPLPNGEVVDMHSIAAARASGGDTVAVTLEPNIDNGAILMRGTMEGGRIEGRWEQTRLGHGDGARGTFAMDRISVIESEHHQD